MFKIKNPLARKNTAPVAPVLSQRAERIFQATGGAPVRSASRPPTFAYVDEGAYRLAIDALRASNVRHTGTWDDALGGYTIIIPR